MRAIVVGAGEVGFDVARLLAMEQHDVVVIDLDAEALEKLGEKLDVMTIHGSGTSAKVLTDAGIHNAHMMIAVTTLDEVNIIACMMADRLGVKTTVARVRSEELTGEDSVFSISDFGLDLVIHPEESASAEVVRLIRRASATDVLELADGRLHLVGCRIDKDSPVIGKSMIDLARENPDLIYRIMALMRGMRTILPRGTERIRRNDQIFVLARPKVVPLILKALGKDDTKITEVMILGGNKVGARIAAQLGEQKQKHVKLIEPDRELAEQLSDSLAVFPNVLVINGEATDIDLMVMEGLSDMDAFVAVTDDEESNLVTCLLAKHLRVKKTVALLSKGAYIPISQSIGLDAAVNKKLAISREIMRFLRGKHVLSVATVHGLDAEILEIEAMRRSKITRAPLKDLDLPKQLLIGAVSHGKRLEVATGNTVIEAGDRAFIFVLHQYVEEAQKLFSK